MSRLGPTGLTQLLTNIKTWVTTKLGNYVTTDTTQTVTGKKLFTNAAIQLDSIVSMSGSTMFIDTSAAAPRGEFPAEAHRVGRIYIGDNTSYNGSWFIVDPTIDTNKAYYRMVTTNPDNTDSTRFSITWDGSKTGARCRKNVSQGDLLPSGNNTYNLGADDLKWDIGYIHNLIGSNKENASEDANDYYSTTGGSHMTFYTTSNGGTKLSNVPAAVNTQLESRTIRYLSASDWNVEQICHNTNGLYYRKGNNNGWGDWKTFAFTDSNITGTAANVTGTVAIANGGTGATTRLNAVKALTNESVASPTHFLTITTNYAKAGYTNISQVKTVLGITGDMGSHSDSEYVHKTGDESISGAKTFSSTISGSISGNAGTATQFSANTTVALTGDATGTSAGSKKGWSVPVTLANSGVTAGDYGPSADASPAHSGTFTVPSITVDAKGRITAASTKTITLPSDNNTDTKVTQTVTTGNSAYPVLLCATANATATGTTTSRFSTGLTVNARYSSIYITNKYDTANTKGVRNTSNYNNGILYFRSYDNTEMGTIRCESNKGGYQQIYMLASNYIKDGAIDPEGTRTNCYIAVRVRDNGSKTIYTDGSWENSLTPYADNTHSLGTQNLKWKDVYANNYYKGTTAFGDIVTHNASEFLTAHPTIAINSVPVSQPSVKLQNGDTFTYVSYVNRDANGHADTIYTTTATLSANIPRSIATRTSSGTWTISGVPKGSILYIKGYITLDPDNIYHADSYDVTLISGAEMLVGRGMSDTMASAHSGNNIVSNTLGMILLVNGTGASGTRDVIIELSNGAMYNLAAYQ